MAAKAMAPFGEALWAYLQGDSGAELIVRRDDGLESPLPAGHFFRKPEEFTAIENAALVLCRGRVLDAGAGTGLHSLVLQKKGLAVTAIDINSRAVKVMSRRGVADARRADVFTYEGGPFDTILMLGHGIGMAETLAGLDRFLARAHELAATDGQVLLDSLDVRATDDPRNLAYHEALRRAGRYIGEISMQFEFRGKAGPYCTWLQVDPEALGAHAHEAGWKSEVVCAQADGDYLARLTRKRIT